MSHTVQTLQPDRITLTSARLGASADSGAVSTDLEVLFSTDGISWSSLGKISGSGSRSIRTTKSSLTSGTLYYTRARLTWDAEELLGDVITFSTLQIEVVPPPGHLLLSVPPAPIVGIATTVTAPAGHMSLHLSPAPDVGVYVVVSPPSGLLTIGTTSPSTIAGTGVLFDAPPAHFTFWPKGGVHEAPHLPYPLKVSRTRPSHWFSSRRDIVRK